MSDTLLCGHSSRSMFANKLVHRAPHLLQHPATTLPFSVSASKGGKHNAYEVLNHKLGTGSRFPPVCLSQSPAANGATHAHAPSPSSVNAIKGNKANSAEPPQSAEATPKTQYIATLLLQCPDQKGVIAAVSQLLYGFQCNVIESDQFTDASSNTFFQRISFEYQDIIIGPGNTIVLERAVHELAQRYHMEYSIHYRNKLKRIAILVSKQDHCLYDLLIRYKSGELNAHIPLILSNHPDLGHIADMFGVPFKVLPIDRVNKELQEHQLEDALKEYDIDLVVLARYMQIFSPAFCERHWRHTINIHHSFLPAFEGARPYHRAHERGVKIIGATAHYATSELDAGPIVDQGVSRITHRDSVEDMVRKGKDLERLVLARAVRWVVEDRVIVHGNKTVVFED